MNHYKLTQEDLEDFAKKVYEEACCGYLDLKDSVCVGLVSTFLEGKTIFDTNLNGSSYLGIAALNSGSNTVSSGSNTVSFQPGIAINRSGTSLSDPHPVPSLPPLVLPPIIQDGMQEISNGMQEILNGSSILNVNHTVGSTVWLNSNSNVVLIANTQEQEQERRRR